MSVYLYIKFHSLFICLCNCATFCNRISTLGPSLCTLRNWCLPGCCIHTSVLVYSPLVWCYRQATILSRRTSTRKSALIWYCPVSSSDPVLKEQSLSNANNTVGSEGSNAARWTGIYLITSQYRGVSIGRVGCRKNVPITNVCMFDRPGCIRCWMFASLGH